MTTLLIDPHAAEKIEANRHRLRARSWGGTEAVCMMSALVSGAQSTDDCVTAGWPEWLAETNVYLFDADVGAEDEDAARYQFALDVATAVQSPRDYDKARDMFLIARLDTGDHSALKSLASVEGDWTAQRDAIQSVVSLLRRRIAGEDVAAEMKQAADAASYASHAAADTDAADPDAAEAAAYAAAAAAYAADANAAGAAADASYADSYAEAADANAAARRDLIVALGEHA